MAGKPRFYRSYIKVNKSRWDRDKEKFETTCDNVICDRGNNTNWLKYKISLMNKTTEFIYFFYLFENCSSVSRLTIKLFQKCKGDDDENGWHLEVDDETR